MVKKAELEVNTITISKDDFGPRNAQEELVFAEERFRIGVQYMIRKAMKRNYVSNTKLADLLGAPKSFVDRLFAADCEITIRELARVFHVLKDECFLTTTTESWPF